MAAMRAKAARTAPAEIPASAVPKVDTNPITLSNTLTAIELGPSSAVSARKAKLKAQHDEKENLEKQKRKENLALSDTDDDDEIGGSASWISKSRASAAPAAMKKTAEEAAARLKSGQDQPVQSTLLVSGQKDFRKRGWMAEEVRARACQRSVHNSFTVLNMQFQDSKTVMKVVRNSISVFFRRRRDARRPRRSEIAIRPTGTRPPIRRAGRPAGGRRAARRNRRKTRRGRRRTPTKT